MMKASHINDQSKDTNKEYMSQKSTNIGDSIPIDNSVNHYELPNLAQCNLRLNLINYFDSAL